MGGHPQGRSAKQPSLPTVPSRRLLVEELESRVMPSISALVNDGVLFITGDNNHDHIRVSLDTNANQLVVKNFVDVVGRFDVNSVNSIVINGGTAQGDVYQIDPNVTTPSLIQAGNGNSVLEGGGGITQLVGGAGNDKLIAGPGDTTLAGEGGINHYEQVKPQDTVLDAPTDIVSFALPVITPAPTPVENLTPDEVQQLIERAAAANANQGAIIAVVDRGGRVLGVRVEGGVDPAITGNTQNLVFAIDGALAEARTGAFFGNNQAPLTSRTIESLSQSTITQREVESNPSITDPNSTVAGPGFVAPIHIGGHFPPGIANTPQVDLYDIQATNRDTTIQHTPNGNVTLPARFNINPAYVPIPLSQFIVPPDSYGFISGLEPNAIPRGIGTLPGGIPIFKNGQEVGGIGIFFPGKTGFADEENSSLSTNFDPKKPDLSVEAEFMAFAALGGLPQIGLGIGTLGGVAPVPGIALPFGRIDLVGVTLDIFGPHGDSGPYNLVALGKTLGAGDPNSGTNEPVDKAGDQFIAGQSVPSGWLVTPHDGVGITAAQVTQIINNGIAQAALTRAAIRLPFNSPAKMVFAVCDQDGNIVGLYRQPDATVFSIGVAVAKARNVAYYNNANELQPADQLPGVKPGTALTNRSFRYLAEPRFPEGINGYTQGPFSILNDGGTNPFTGLNEGPPLPASAFQSVQGFNAFNPDTNFHDPFNPLNQSGVVFFPGSSGVYQNGALIGGFGVSGDGVAQDDVITFGGIGAFDAPANIRIDQVFVRGVRVPYTEFDRNPDGGIVGGF
jgi:uncharacterized protein GlcG (DUF336 family)